MKKLAFILSLTGIMVSASAQTTPDDYIAAFFAKVEKADYKKLLDEIPVGVIMEKDTALMNRVIQKLEKNPEEFGKYCGYEQLEKEETSPSFVSYTCFIKYKNAPQKIVFIFYKPEENWQLNRINIAGGAAARTGRSNQQPVRFRQQ